MTSHKGESGYGFGLKDFGHTNTIFGLDVEVSNFVGVIIKFNLVIEF